MSILPCARALQSGIPRLHLLCHFATLIAEFLVQLDKGHACMQCSRGAAFCVLFELQRSSKSNVFFTFFSKFTLVAPLACLSNFDGVLFCEDALVWPDQ